MCSSFFALTRTCKHLKLGLHRKWLGKMLNLIFGMWIIIFFVLWNLFPLLSLSPPPPPTHSVPSPSLNPISLQSPAEVLLHFFTFKEDHVSLFLVKMFLTSVHTRLKKRSSVFFFFLFFNCIWPYTYKGPSQEFCGAGKNSHFFQTAIISRELGNKP